MAHGYHLLQHWNKWLAQNFLGDSLLQTEQQLMMTTLNKHFGKHALLIGVPQQNSLFNATTIPCHTLASPIRTTDTTISTYIESDFHELPIFTGSIDLVMLPHTLEMVDNPRQLLSEACRIIKPEGLIIITGFNIYSFFGLKKLFVKEKIMPWRANFIHTYHLQQWLRLADFQIERQERGFFRPPLTNQSLFHKINILEKIGKTCIPALGGVYTILARAKVIPLTPIRLKWKQQLSSIQVSSTIPGNMAR